jgi:hypothetical protein
MAFADAAGDGAPAPRIAPRESFGAPGAVAAARRRPMSERLELALSWNSVAVELRAALAGIVGAPGHPGDR